MTCTNIFDERMHGAFFTAVFPDSSNSQCCFFMLGARQRELAGMMRQNGNIFWKCSGYHTAGKSCKHIENTKEKKGHTFSDSYAHERALPRAMHARAHPADMFGKSINFPGVGTERRFTASGMP